MRARFLIALLGALCRRRRRRTRRTPRRRCSRSAGRRTRTRSTRSSARTRRTSRIWAINWDLLVNFSPKDLTPGPGIAQSWDISRRQEDDHLPPRPEREVVGRQADHLGGRQVLARGAGQQRRAVHRATRTTSPRSTRRTPTRSWSTPSGPTRGSSAACSSTSSPSTSGGRCRSSELTGSYKPELPLVGSGPYVVTEFQPNRIIEDGAEPELPRRRSRSSTRSSSSGTATQDAAERALQVGEVDMVPEVSAAGFARLGEQPNIKTLKAPSPAFTQLAFNLCSKQNCPDAKFNPAIQDPAVRQAMAYAVDRERINEIAARGTSFPATGSCRRSTSRSTRCRRDDYPYDPEKAQADPRRRRLAARRRRPADQGRRGALVQPLRALGVAVQHPGGASSSPRMAKAVGIDFNVQVVSTDKLTELTDAEGRTARRRRTSTRSSGAGAAIRTTRASCSASLTTERDRRLVRLVLLEPRVRPAVQAAGRRVRHRRSARRSSSRWSRSPSATCRTSCSPSTRTCRPTGRTGVANVDAGLPGGRTATRSATQVGYAPLADARAAGGSPRPTSGGGGSAARARVLVA